LGITGESVSPGHGLTAVLTEQTPLSEALVKVPLKRDHEGEEDSPHQLNGELLLLPGGGPVPNPSELLASHRMREVLEQCTRIADLVIIDTTPLLSVSDSIALLDFVSGVVLVARLNGTTKDAVRRFMKTISNTNATILGAVATGATAGGLYARYGYGYYGYGYGYGAGYANGNGNGNGTASANGNGSRRFRRRERRKREPESKQSS
jgi:Mrp family chromosome partitioning ATPase